MHVNQANGCKTKRLRVLLIAEAANPEWASVPLVGWAHATALMSRGDVEGHLVTQIRNREAILRAGLSEGRDFTAIDSEAIMKPAYKLATLLRGGAGKGWTMVTALSSLAYPYFEHLVWKHFGERIRNHEFDVVHRLTPLSPTSSSILAKRCARAGVPFIMGPLNGGVPWPKEFDAARRKEKEWLSYVRGVYKLLPGYRSTRKHATAILIGSKATWEQMPARYHHKCHYVPENAIDPDRFPSARVHPELTLPLKAAFVGRVVPYKGADMLLDAAADLVRAGRLRLDLYGDGPETPTLQAQTDRLGIADGVTMHGFVPHGELHGKLSQADVFAFPSIREFGGAVVLEAMALGVVPLVVDYGGPGELVTDETGYRVPIGPRDQIIAAFREKLTRLCDDPSPLPQMAVAAQKRVADQFTWQAKAAQVSEIYRRVLNMRGTDETAHHAAKASSPTE